MVSAARQPSPRPSSAAASASALGAQPGIGGEDRDHDREDAAPCRLRRGGQRPRAANGGGEQHRRYRQRGAIGELGGDGEPEREGREPGRRLGRAEPPRARFDADLVDDDRDQHQQPGRTAEPGDSIGARREERGQRGETGGPSCPARRREGDRAEDEERATLEVDQQRRRQRGRAERA